MTSNNVKEHQIASSNVLRPPSSKIVRPSDDHPIKSPTDSPSSLTVTQNKYYVECNDVYSIQSHCNGNYKGGGAAEGRASSFIVAAEGRHLCSGYE